MASSRSDGSSSSSRRPAVSPILYQVGPMEYEPPVFCDCKAKVVRWISWSLDNPSRRYFKCRNARVWGCEFFAWCDGLTSNFLRELLNDLRDIVMSLRTDKQHLRQKVEECRARLEEESTGLEAARKELVAVREIVQDNLAEMTTLKARIRMCGLFVCGVVWQKLNVETQTEAFPEVTLTDALVELCECGTMACKSILAEPPCLVETIADALSLTICWDSC
uniref:GRF-type domain-containing protein n=1 Tax=Oryza punctata TaxID=4537 RepID=A0A0E0ME47_ORYPU